MQNFLHPKENRRPALDSVDYPFLILLLSVLGVGLMMLWSASAAQSQYDTLYTSSVRYLGRQGLCAVLGLCAMAFFSRVDTKVWYRLAVPVYIAGILLLLSVLFFGTAVNGAKRWISLGPVQFQPSELAKFSEILFLARLTRDYGERAHSFRYGVMGFGAALMGILIPLALEKHLSAIMLMGLVAVTMMFIAGTPPKWIGLGAALAVAFVAVYVSVMGYAGDRITAWIHPESDPADTGYQILQSLYAIGSGGLLGLGFGKSRQKYLYLPFQYNDYIFAIICEELGLVGACAIIVLFMALIARGYYIALNARDRFSTILGAGLVSLIAVQTVLNLGVVTNLLPSTGIALPFFSYGGTALAVNLGEMGILLEISRHRKESKVLEE